jgi:quercetin dioxygenase-like cupin family protein
LISLQPRAILDELSKGAQNMSSSTAPRAQANDPVVVDAKHYTVEYEDERVRVLRIRYGPGEKSRMHSHPESISVLIRDATIRMTYPDGRTEDIQAAAGAVMHMPVVEHLPENIGDTALEVIQVELK